MLHITLHFHYKYMQSPQTYVIGSKYHVLYKHACAGDSSTESEAIVTYCKGSSNSRGYLQCADASIQAYVHVHMQVKANAIKCMHSCVVCMDCLLPSSDKEYDNGFVVQSKSIHCHRNI